MVSDSFASLSFLFWKWGRFWTLIKIIVNVKYFSLDNWKTIPTETQCRTFLCHLQMIIKTEIVHQSMRNSLVHKSTNQIQENSPQLQQSVHWLVQKMMFHRSKLLCRLCSVSFSSKICYAAICTILTIDGVDINLKYTNYTVKQYFKYFCPLLMIYIQCWLL